MQDDEREEVTSFWRITNNPHASSFKCTRLTALPDAFSPAEISIFEHF